MKNIFLTYLACFFLLSCAATVNNKNVSEKTKSEPNTKSVVAPLPSKAYTTADGYESDYKHNLNVVYFIPKDLDTVAGYHKRLSEILLMGQKYYKDEMTRNGYPGKTFGLWVNQKNRVKIITIFGKKNKEGYPRAGLKGAIAEEINAYFKENPQDQNSLHTLILLPPYGYKADGSPIDGPFYGIGKWCYAMDYEGLDPKYIGTSKFTKWYGGMMHELGHGLNLPHNCLKVSEKSLLGTALMANGNYTLSVSKTSLTATDAAILNTNQIFNKDDKTYYGKVVARIKEIKATYDAARSVILISGQFVSDTKVNSIVYYNDPNVNNEGIGVAQDYNAVSWESKPIGADKFSLEIPLSDLEFKGNTEYELRLKLVHENGTVTVFNYVYKFVNNVPVLDFSTPAELSKTGWSVSASSEETSGEGKNNGRALQLIDGNPDTYWHSKWSTPAAAGPHQVTIDFGGLKSVLGVSLTQRNNLSRAVKDFELLYSTDGIKFSSAGNFVLLNNATTQYFKLPVKKSVRFIRIMAKSAYDGQKFTSLAEIGVF